jgi:6-phosphogluconolactonase (cycloisomerase 2 family)
VVQGTDPDQIRSYAIQDGGSLTLRSSVESPRGLGILAEPTGRFLFGFADVTTCCHSSRETDLLTYAIAADGGLSLSGRFGLDLYDAPSVRAATSRSLYMLTWGRYHTAFHVLSIDGSNRGATFEAAAIYTAWGMVVSPTGRSFYALGVARNGEEYVAIEGYRLSPDGTSEFVQSVSLPPSLPWSVSVQLYIHPSGRFLYVPTSATYPRPATGQIFLFSADDAGAFRQTGSMEAPVGDLTPYPDGRFLYLSRGNEIDVYAVDSETGALRLIDHTLTTGLPASISPGVADPSGRFLYASGEGQIWGYAIGTFGSLRFLGSLATGGRGPIVVTPPAR